MFFGNIKDRRDHTLAFRLLLTSEKGPFQIDLLILFYKLENSLLFFPLNPQEERSRRG